MNWSVCRRPSEQWGGDAIDDTALAGSIGLYNRVSSLLTALREKAGRSELRGGSAALQEAYNRASISSPGESIAFLEAILKEDPDSRQGEPGVPLYLFGNMLPDPEAFALFESCGVHIVSDDLCTGSRLFAAMETGGGDGLLNLARGILGRPSCARTFSAERPGSLGDDVAAGGAARGRPGRHRIHGEILRSLSRPSSRRPGCAEKGGDPPAAARGRLYAPFDRSAQNKDRGLCGDDEVTAMMKEYFTDLEAGIEKAIREGNSSHRKLYTLELARLGKRLYSGTDSIAWCGITAPFDLLNAMGVTSCFVEFIGAMLASTGAVGPFIEETDHAGYSSDCVQLSPLRERRGHQRDDAGAGISDRHD